MRLNSDELVTLTDKVINKITMDLFIANQSDELDVYLKNIGYEEDMPTYNNFYDYRNAKILIVGDCQVGSDHIKAISKKLGINPKKIEIINDYEKMTNIDFSKLEYNSKYSDIIIGPNPHKTSGIGKYNSLISMIESNPERYPKLIKAISGQELKITKSSIEEALKKTQQYLSLIGY